MADVRITVNPNGPLLVQGDVDLLDRNGERFEAPGKGIALCRCGQSANKPFCDGSHGSTGFNAPTFARKG